jgi:hypothetical protein
MILFLAGSHEQQFNRLVDAADDLARNDDVSRPV